MPSLLMRTPSVKSFTSCRMPLKETNQRTAADTQSPSNLSAQLVKLSEFGTKAKASGMISKEAINLLDPSAYCVIAFESSWNVLVCPVSGNFSLVAFSRVFFSTLRGGFVFPADYDQLHARGIQNLIVNRYKCTQSWHDSSACS